MSLRDEPDWGPLVEAVGELLAGWFMWMFEVELDDGTRLQAYKHIATRGYLHLDSASRAFAYGTDELYQRVALDLVLEAVFSRWLASPEPTPDEVLAAWKAIEAARRGRPGGG
jgi:hypothetical protein